MRLRTILLAAFASLATFAAVAQTPGVNSNYATVFTLLWEASTYKATYSATVIATPASSATDFCGLTGSATKNVRLRRIIISGQDAAVVASEPVAIIKRSTANTLGTGLAMVAVPYNSTSSAASVQAEVWTANPTLGTAVGLLADQYWSFSGVGSTPVTTFEFGRFGSPIILTGVAQSVNVNLNAISYASGGTLSCTFEWTEE